MSFNKKKAIALIEAILYQLGEPVDIVKLTKLLYIIERKVLMDKGYSVTSDRLSSMDYGPVTSYSYDELKELNGDDDLKKRLQRTDDLISLIEAPETSRLSAFEMTIIKYTVERFGQKGKWELVGYCHDNFPEWEDPNGSSKRIRIRKLIDQVGISDEQREILEDRIETGEFLDSISAL